MSIKLIMEPRHAGSTWKSFCTKEHRYGIAIDGYVRREPLYDFNGPWVNLNHHECCDRLTTRATCAQCLVLIRQGLLERFRDEHKNLKINVYANDCDQDVCLTYFLIAHSGAAKSVHNPLLNKLVHVEDMADTTAGAYPFDKDSKIMREVAWIFNPYTDFRLSGELSKKDADSYTRVVMEVNSRISAYITGNGEEMDLNLEYDVIGGGKGWSLVREIGAHARMAMMSDGIQAWVSVRDRHDGKWTYTIGRTSMCVPFDNESLYKRLNEIEGASDPWGGGNTIGGSPRESGSSISPEDIGKVVNECLRNI